MAPSTDSCAPESAPTPMAVKPTAMNEADSGLRIVDIRGKAAVSNTREDLKRSITTALSAKNATFSDTFAKFRNQSPVPIPIRSIPTLVLYDDYGLELFDKITYNDDYYLTNAEIDIFKRHATQMVRDYVQDGSALIELGCGAMRKTKYILEAISQLGRKVTYYAVDLSEASLKSSLLPLVQAFPNIDFVGLWGTYDDSIEYSRVRLDSASHRIFLWLGSSIGNMNRTQAAQFLTGVCQNGMQPGDTFFCGIDRRNTFEQVSLAYNDREGITRQFIMNGLSHVNSIFGSPVFDPSKFEYVSMYNEEEGRHEAYYKSLTHQTVQIKDITGDLTFKLEKGEHIHIEYSYKFSQKEVQTLAHAASFRVVGQWADPSKRYDMWMFQKPEFDLSAGEGSRTPSLNEMQNIWKTWDTIVTMIPENGHLRKPLELRHPYIFYLGHLPAFMDIMISRALDLEFTSPCFFAQIFERGIDPDMDDPTCCHPHSKVPDNWPSLDDVLDYQGRVRAKVAHIYKKHGTDPSLFPKRLQRVLFMVYEHDAQHLETFLYMLVQDPLVKTPKGVSFPVLKYQCENAHIPESSYSYYTGGQIEIGLDDLEDADLVADAPQPAAFGWDMEKPSHPVYVNPFQMQNRPVSVAEYWAFLDVKDWSKELIPASWSCNEKNQWLLVSAFGKIPISFGWKWPVSVSCIQAQAYATFKNMRLPSEHEYLFARKQSTESHKHNPVNVGFVRWVPTNVQMDTKEMTDLVGQGWEITSTMLHPYPGYIQSKLYPGYSSDFFDDKHQILMGGSWATPQRIAHRSTFRNWYQSQYPYMFSKFRLCKIDTLIQ